MMGILLRTAFALLSLFVSFANSQTAEVTTERITTTTLSPTIPTTTAAPHPSPTPIPPNTDLAHCLCDLTQDACDVDCCCDAACSASDRLAFSSCIDQSVSVNTQSCIQSSMVFRNNTPYQVNETVPGLFCVYTNNNPESNYYSVPELINTDEAFVGNASRYESYSFVSNPINTTISNTDYYMSGDPIYTVYEILNYDFLRLPLKSTSNACVFSPIPFLYGQSASCSSVRKDELASKCQAFSVIDAQTYFLNFKVAATPQAIIFDNNTDTVPPVQSYNSSLLIPIVVDSVLWCLDDSGYNHSCSFSSPPLPQYSGGVCRNAVIQVIYLIESNGTSGITSVNVSFTFRNITEAHLPLMQTFQTNFFKTGQDSSFRFSGNPGYLNGEPVMAGTLATNTTADRVAIVLDSDRNNWMTILSPGADGLCNRTSRSPVLFNEGLRSGCFVTFSLQSMGDMCNQTAYEIMSALRGPKPSTYVASFGNTPVTSVGDWVKVIDNPPPLNVYSSTTTIGECNNFPTAMNIQIIYANVGAINNRQPQIIGVKYEYVFQPSVRFQCVGPYCNPSSMDQPQKFEVSTSVTFIDSSSPAVGSYGAIPQGVARLPEDFFYPLT